MPDPLRILIIDDSDDDREFYRRCLDKSTGSTYRIDESTDGEHGLRQLDHHEYDCILLDYSLPGRNGVEVLKRIRAKHTFVPVVILTGQGNETVAVVAMKEGAQDYIAKSTITPEALERVVRIAIAHGTMTHRIHEQRKALEIFTYALAHDLREPTNTVRSFVDLILKHESLSDRGLTYFTHVQKAANRMQLLIDTVYFYAQLNANEQIEKDSCGLEEVFREVEENLGQLMRSKPVSLTEDAQLPQLTFNRSQLQQVLQNLLSNAIKHSGDAVTIHLGANEEADQWKISISDTGPGIEPEYVDKIFEPFKRMSSNPERGLGLGLAICRKIVEFHGGKIWCESALGKGTSFFFTIPKIIAKPPEVVVPHPHAIPKAQWTNQQHLARIMLVDDNDADLMLNQIMLIEQTHLQCEVVIARDGQEALNKLKLAQAQGNPIDLVLLDINMPVMSGFELLAQLKQIEALHDTVVIMCSTSSYDIDKRMALSMGAAGYLTKPPQFPQLKAILQGNPHFMLQQQGDAYTLLRAA